MPCIPRSLKERFDEKYIPEPNSGCWLWTASCRSGGYGQIADEDGRIIGAHQASYLIHKGEYKSLHVCHHCDNPLCVNPDHLFLGTMKDNLADMTRKGRRRSNPPKGSKNKQSRLTEEEVKEIRIIYSKGCVSHQNLADMYGVSKRNITVILNRKGWKHI